MCCCFNHLFNCIELELNACWQLKVVKIITIIIKNDIGQISIEFPESSNLEKSYFICSLI